MNTNKLSEAQIKFLHEKAEKEKQFLSAWKEGVKLAGKQYFNVLEQQDIDVITDKRDLKPNINLIDDSLDKLSTKQGLFLLALYYYYDFEGGQKRFENLGYPSIVHAMLRMDSIQRGILSYLDGSQTEW